MPDETISIKPKGVRSWLDPQWSRVFGAALGERLADRCKDQPGVVLTLTYDPGNFTSPQDCWERQAIEQHIPLFFRRLGRAIGEDLAARWFAKKEFQKNGYIHFHCVILGLSRIDHEVLTKAWGWGWTWIDRISEKSLRYICKYVAKASGGLPEFLYSLRPKAVKMTSVARGFWGATKPRPPGDGQTRQSIDSWACPLWRIAKQRNTVLVKREGEKYPKPFKVSFSELMDRFKVLGVRMIGIAGTWYEFDVGWMDLSKELDRLDRGEGGELATLADVLDIANELQMNNHPIQYLRDDDLVSAENFSFT